MGIQGLLKGLNPLLVAPPPTAASFQSSPDADVKTNKPPLYSIRQFADQTLAVDAASWLHKSGYSVAERLMESVTAGKRDPFCERKIETYMNTRCEELLNHAKIRRIVLVFDGKRCPLKAGTNKEREARRRDTLAEARRLKAEGKSTEAGEKYRSCVKVPDEMARTVAQAVSAKWAKDGRVQCLFAPYEADAQLAMLCAEGVADAVVTEDSDVLVYSAACNVPFPIIYKLDRDSGSCDVISMDWLLSPPPTRTQQQRQSGHSDRGGFDHDGMSSLRRHLPPPARKGSSSVAGALLSCLRALSSREARLRGCGARMFVQACVLSGCDYAPSQLSGVGLVTAFKLIKENAFRDASKRFQKLLKSMPRGKVVASSDGDVHDLTRKGSSSSEKKTEKELISEYEELLARSEAVFYYHLVRASDGSIVSLVSPPQPDASENDQGVDSATDTSSSSSSNAPIETREQFSGSTSSFLPAVDRFDGDLSFVGSTEHDCSEQPPSSSDGDAIFGRRSSTCSRSAACSDAKDRFRSASTEDSSKKPGTCSRDRRSVFSFSNRKPDNLSSPRSRKSARGERYSHSALLELEDEAMTSTVKSAQPMPSKNPYVRRKAISGSKQSYSSARKDFCRHNNESISSSSLFRNVKKPNASENPFAGFAHEPSPRETRSRSPLLFITNTASSGRCNDVDDGKPFSRDPDQTANSVAKREHSHLSAESEESTENMLADNERVRQVTLNPDDGGSSFSDCMPIDRGRKRPKATNKKGPDSERPSSRDGHFPVSPSVYEQSQALPLPLSPRVIRATSDESTLAEATSTRSRFFPETTKSKRKVERSRTASPVRANLFPDKGKDLGYTHRFPMTDEEIDSDDDDILGPVYFGNEPKTKLDAEPAEKAIVQPPVARSTLSDANMGTESDSNDVVILEEPSGPRHSANGRMSSLQPTPEVSGPATISPKVNTSSNFRPSKRGRFITPYQSSSAKRVAQSMPPSKSAERAQSKSNSSLMAGFAKQQQSWTRSPSFSQVNSSIKRKRDNGSQDGVSSKDLHNGGSNGSKRGRHSTIKSFFRPLSTECGRPQE